MVHGPAKQASKQVKDGERKLRAYALGFPEVREDHPWGHSAFIERWIDESYRAIAPKKLLATLEARR
jgi:hypothetical protein